MKTKREMREAAIERLNEMYKAGPYTTQDIVMALAGDNGWVSRIIDLLSDDEPQYDNDAYAMGPRDADGILWLRGDMSDSPWGVIEYTFFDGEEWSVSGHDISAPWIPANSIRHTPMRTATQRESDLVELLKDAAKDYQHERSEVEWQKELYKGLSDHVVSDMMLLPRDDDGEVIHIGDKITYHGLCERHQGKVLEVKGIMSLSEGIDAVVVYDTELVKLYANNCRHYRKPTVDEILDELEGMRGTGDYEDVIKRCAELGRTLRELLKEGEDEDQA